ncbi:MAG: glycoside hydrolase family 127 protein, partial [Muribaculaceae bacterium]|nr:glycoside hydrolase family 127 protein [Muribaculaceae bacterium]
MNINKIIAVALLGAGVWLSTASQSIYPGVAQSKIKLPTKGDVKAESFDLKDIRLLDSRFHDNMRRDSAWLASLSTDRLLHSFRTTAGVPAGREGGYMTVRKLGGWESLDCELRGHTTGHVMSALALMYAATGDSIMKTKGDSIVSGLRTVQQAHGNGYVSAFPEELINRNIRGTSVWAPWYTLHKILAGLIDQYVYAGNPEALEVATDMGKWVSAKLRDVDETTRLKMLRNEFGGINEAFYNLYSITADPEFLSVAEFFYHHDVIDPLKAGNADLGTKHTNTFIPKVLGEMRRYEITGDEKSLELSRFFWDEMLAHHTFSPGCSSDKEHYFKPEEFSGHISGYTGETCCTYNMLKLTRHLFCNNPESHLMDFYERALYNHILGQQDPETGMVAYFLPLATGSHRVYSTPENSFWCCVGSGFENHSKYGEQIYSKTADGLLVNLFIPSQLDWKDKEIKVTQLTEFPASPSTLLN